MKLTLVGAMAVIAFVISVALLVYVVRKEQEGKDPDIEGPQQTFH